LSSSFNSPFRDANDVIIDKILDRNTVEPIEGFTDEQLMVRIKKQNDIMVRDE
jgi:hypothetical protein